jgi:anti-sigma B factor antagonist
LTEVEISREGEIAIVRTMQRVDTSNADLLEAELIKLLGTGARLLVFDLSGTKYIASSGLRILLSTAKKLANSGGKMALSGLNPQVREVFTIAGFDRIFKIYPSLEEAVKGVSPK